MKNAVLIKTNKTTELRYKKIPCTINKDSKEVQQESTRKSATSPASSPKFGRVHLW